MAEFDRLMESIDSLWFFNSVLSSSASPIPAQESEKQSTGDDPVEEDAKGIIPNSPEEEEEEVKPAPPADNAAEVRVELVVFGSKPETASERRKRLARRWRSKKRQILLRELDLCFDSLYYKTYGGFSFSSLYGFPAVAEGKNKKMPPLDDSLAMKRHLKSWAHAVACTVK